MPLQRIDRRTFLRAAGVAIGLPFLDAMVPAGAAEAKKALAQQPRMVLDRPAARHVRAELLPREARAATTSRAAT